MDNKYKNQLNLLMKENESIKRDLDHKKAEYERQSGNIKKLNG